MVVCLEHLEASLGNEVAVIVGYPVLGAGSEVAAGDVVEFSVAQVESAGCRITLACIGVDDSALSGGGIEVPDIAVGYDVEDAKIGILAFVLQERNLFFACAKPVGCHALVRYGPLDEHLPVAGEFPIHLGDGRVFIVVGIAHVQHPAERNLAVKSHESGETVTVRRGLRGGGRTADVVYVEMRRCTPVDGRTAFRQEMADVFRVHDIRTCRGIRFLRNFRAVRYDDLPGIDQQRRAVGKDVEGALSATAVDEMDVEASVSPFRERFAHFRFRYHLFLRRNLVVQVVLPRHFRSFFTACYGCEGRERT